MSRSPGWSGTWCLSASSNGMLVRKALAEAAAPKGAAARYCGHATGAAPCRDCLGRRLACDGAPFLGYVVTGPPRQSLDGLGGIVAAGAREARPADDREVGHLMR